MLVGWIVSSRLKGKFRKYSQIQLKQNLSGADVARLMLADNGISDVKVISVEGQLSDHYNPVNKTVNLSADVYNGRNAAATAVAVKLAEPPDFVQLVKTSPEPASRVPFNNKFCAFIVNELQLTATSKKSNFLIMM